MTAAAGFVAALKFDSWLNLTAGVAGLKFDNARNLRDRLRRENLTRPKFDKNEIRRLTSNLLYKKKEVFRLLSFSFIPLVTEDQHKRRKNRYERINFAQLEQQTTEKITHGFYTFFPNEYGHSLILLTF